MKRVVIIPFLLIVFTLSATPIGEQRARNIALNFFGGSGATRTSSAEVELVWAGNDKALEVTSASSSRLMRVEREEEVENALLYLYNRLDAEGFVVVAGDDKVQKPIIAFSRERAFDIENVADGAKAILQSWSDQISALRSNNTLSAVTRADDDSVGNVVCSYDTASWAQGKPYNREVPSFDGETMRAGCVAVAAGILCHYHKWPEKGVGSTPEYTYTDDRGVKRTMPSYELGRTYDYSKMKTSYKDSYTEEEGAAVAALLFDLGRAFKMNYGQEDSGANVPNAGEALVNMFGYSKSMMYYKHLSYPDEEQWCEMLRENIRENGPMIYRGSDKNGGGHAFILDAYTDKGYFSVNYGWGGSSDGFYLLPNLTYFKSQSGIFNLVPDRDGSSQYIDHLTTSYFTASNSGSKYRGLYSKATSYKVGEEFKIYVSAYNAGIATYTGTFYVAHCDKDDNIKEIIYEKSRSIAPDKSHGYAPTCKLSKTIEKGDCLRMFYTRTGSEELVMARRHTTSAYDKVYLWATPEEVAESMTLAYEQEGKVLTINSSNALQYSVRKSSGEVVVTNEVESFTPIIFDLSTYEKGTYTFSFATGGDPYELTIIL